MLSVLLSGVLCFLAGCGMQESPVFLRARDHAVYTALLREQLTWPRGGEHGRACVPDGPIGSIAVVGTTQPLPPGTPARDEGWSNYLPKPVAPLLKTLRALDREPALAIEQKLLTAGVPVELIPESLAARTLWPAEPTAESSRAPGPLFWFSRVVYSSDGDWALVYAAQVCPGITPAMVEEAEPGAYQAVFLATLQRQPGDWVVHGNPLFLDIESPRVR